MKVSYNWLKWYIPNVVESEKLRDVFTYHLTEVEGIVPLRADGSIETDPTSNGISDWIFDLNILPNRAHDLLSHSGVARELSGQLGISFTDPTKTYEDIMTKRSLSPASLRVDIQTENCRRYSARIIRNIKVGPSPEWVVKHLESIGQRSINNIVDATNLVMYNCGQPTHAFDLAVIVDNTITITSAKNDEELSIVGKDETRVKLLDRDMVISSGGKTLGLAGVKGGRDSGISGYITSSANGFSGRETSSELPLERSSDLLVGDSDGRGQTISKDNSDSVLTTDIVIEVANFDPISVRKTARRLGLLSDSAKRFENDLSPELCDFAMLELSALISEMCPDVTFEEVVDVYPTREEWKKEKTIFISSNLISKKLGINISSSDIEKILTQYQFVYHATDDGFAVTVPPLRLDLVSTTDMIEEIGRVYGYNNIQPVLPAVSFTSQENEMYRKISRIREHLLSLSYNEVMTYTFTNKGEVEVLASARDKNFLRTNLSDGLKKSYEVNKLNAPLLGMSEVKLFEIGTVFVGGIEETHVAFIDKKEIKEMTIEEFFASSETLLEKPLSVGIFQEPDQAISKNIFDSTRVNSFKNWSLYPFITRDISVWVPEGTSSDELQKMYQTIGGELLVRTPECVDMFTKDGKTSYAFRLVFQSYERTLTDGEISIIMTEIQSKISEKGWVVR